MFRSRLLPLPLVLAASLGAAVLPAHAKQAAPDLVALINAYRAAPGNCAGQPAEPVAPLDAAPALAQVRIGAGTFLELALERAGYPSEHAEALFVSGAEEPEAVMRTLREKYCARLLSTEVSAAGGSRAGDGWHIVLARPEPPRRLPDPARVGEETLAAVNAARAVARRCGAQQFAAAPPLRLNPALDAAALAHSEDMAKKRYFSHVEKNGSVVGDRARHAGYAWRTIGENIASGQRTVREAVDGWLDSPGHCANIMNAAFTEMGIGYAVNGQRGTLYWTQVLGHAR